MDHLRNFVFSNIWKSDAPSKVVAFSWQLMLNRIPTKANLTLRGIGNEFDVAFENNGSSKIGVRFEKSIPGGNDLGGICENDRGFFCSANHLVLVDGVGGDDSGKVAINEIFEIASFLSRSGALVLLIKDIEKGVAGNSEVLKSKFGSLPQNVVVIGSHIQPDSRKEKTQPGSLLFTKFGGNQTALLDLAFPDNFTRLHDRSKETPKVMKQLNNLFPNKVTIQLPQDETLLSDWKQHLDRDIETWNC
ncbi:unnamed protein product [Trifolium pratense]|uniref:Uncharacterized protein n=1 Tax=Trifolium pratense TaxID=57577 RepID=A0ACB0LDM9_TRIPR|nr:unnamed protein product [Trifolium pratense]